MDDSGLEVADLGAMHEQIARAIHKIRQDDHHNEEDWRDWQLNVVDEAGNLLVTIPLGTQPA
ncbi:hypothetical protein [Microvirga sp. VF16]|uniref:DUF6894 family protein n=1 Tax=Microvirga sp. VF16 TaxID=2807101 RepID=UPI00193E34B2|nr:hypothetical protein [Microvirga sp. VF16]QRM32617.1 hypothetical protein JO965_31530 [Microvirga sp. VF16]